MLLISAVSTNAEATENTNASVPAAVGGGLTTNIHPNLFTGTAGASIPIEIPPGRSGLQPNLVLTYNNRASNSWLGVGWSLEVGRIQRKTRHGVDYNGDDYQLNMNGALVDLVYIGNDGSGNREYRSKIEGSFYRIKKIVSGNYWEVTDKMGTRYFFGQTTNSRRIDATQARIFTWGLDRVEDTHTNYITYNYSNASTQLYLNAIYYTGHAATNRKATNTITFYSDFNRPDAPYLHTALYIPTRQNVRLIAIKVAANTDPGITQGDLVRVYKLSYTQSPETNRSLLSGIQQFGKDAEFNSVGGITNETTATKLPPITFGWQAGGTGFNQTVTSNSLDWGFDDGRAWVDHDGDGMIDYCRVIGSNNQVRCTLSTGSGFGTEYTSGTLDGGYNEGRAWVDFNADGKADYCRVIGANNQVRCTLSTGSGFGTEYTSGTLDGGNADSRQWADFNGDGMADFCRVNGANNVVMCTLSTGSGFGAEYSASFTGGGFAGSRQWADFNGDGRADFCRIDSNSLANCKVSTGSGFGVDYIAGDFTGADPTGYQWADFNGDGLADFCRVITASNAVSCRLSTGTGIGTEYTSGSLDRGAAEGRQWVDFNGDGKADYCRLSSGGNTARCILSTGLGFIGAEHASGSIDGGYDKGRQWADFNGDGKQDYCRRIGGSGNSLITCTLATAPASDLLVSTSNGIGGTTTLEYTPSTFWFNTQLPFPIQTLSKVTTNDGNGNSADTFYQYQNGYYYFPDREFRGFQRVWVWHPTGPSGERIVTETWFHRSDFTGFGDNYPDMPDAYTMGKPYWIIVWAQDTAAQSLTKRSETQTYYTADDTPPYFNPPSQVLEFNYDGGATLSTRTDYFYDAYGNVILEDQWGNVSDGTDNRSVTRNYTQNTSDWIVGLPLRETIQQGLSTETPAIKANTWFRYDGDNNGSVNTCNVSIDNTVPDKGNLTRIIRYNDNGPDVEIRMAYDQYGNLTCARDAGGNITTTYYDSSFTFPISTVSPLVTATNTQLTATTTYYTGTVTDTGLYGQVKTVRDANNNITTTTYDDLGRVKTITHPDGSSSTNYYESFGGGVMNQHVRTDTSAGLQSWDYFDGFGRTILAKATVTSTQVIRTGTQYDIRGQVWKKTQPYIEGQPVGPETAMTYDAAGRVTQVDYTDDTSTMSCYQALVTVTLDQKGHKKRTVTDTYGRVREVDEYTGDFTNNCTTGIDNTNLYAQTFYEYDALGNLTKVTDDQNNVTEIFYDSLSRKIAMNDPDMGSWAYIYDANGNLLTQTDAKGQTISFTYDELNRVKTKTVEDVSTPINTLTVNLAGAGTGTVTSNPAGIDCGSDCTELYTGGTVTLSAVEDSGSLFVGWSGEDCSGTNDCVVTMDQARTVTATFDLDAQTPWRTNENGQFNTDGTFNHAMGYHFTPLTDGHVTHLGGLFDGTKTVKLFNKSTGAVLATTTLTGTSSAWTYTAITSVPVVQGTTYTVAVYLAGSGGTSRHVTYPLPQTYGDIRIEGSTYISTSLDPDARPTNTYALIMYGQVDIGFVPGSAPTDPCGPLQFTKTLIPQTSVVTLQDFEFLLADVNTVRSSVSLGTLTWQAPAPAVQQAVMAQHLLNLRDYLDDAIPGLIFTGGDATTLPAGTPIKSIHLEELQTAIQAACTS